MRKKINLYKIRDMAVASGRAVFSVRQLASLVGKGRAVATVYLNRLARAGLAGKVLEGKISFSDDDFVVASQIYEPAYVSFSSALSIHGLMKQEPARVECATTRNSRGFQRLGIYCHRVPPGLFFGFSKVEKGASYMMLADKEKAVLDMAYLNILPWPLWEEVRESMDLEKLAGYAERFGGRGSKKLRRMFAWGGRRGSKN